MADTTENEPPMLQHIHLSLSFLFQSALCEKTIKKNIYILFSWAMQEQRLDWIYQKECVVQWDCNVEHMDGAQTLLEKIYARLNKEIFKMGNWPVFFYLPK